ncbi:glycoside hydrolase family 43 protein [Pedobacter psychroterrae]|uniref:Glycosyl hydrolase family 43 n=1 Tax=Pedobacter psychroterrae TaxID=2530453 RepID=A0A4R0NB58_9SPHI|nr:glycoside hydrolase family 43 protein [Pedobacter psychroterrae]TCC97395.1 glycosyl hydrolase family 43 [Pedobacter psychroterrae]
MKAYLFLSALAWLLMANVVANAQSAVDYATLRIRDPFILADKKTKTYYVAVNNNPSFRLYSSKDLKNWKDEGNCFRADADFWGKKDFWAPDLIEYKGKYYIWATFSGTDGKRGTSILVADKPTGPYKPLVNQSTTPADWMALDGTLYIDKKNKPWMLYCHEWLQVGDGKIVAQQLSDDLKKTVGEPKVLFTASEGPWVGPINKENGYITDAPFIYKAKNGEMLMLWSSFSKNGKYAIGVARSASGNHLGPWTQDELPLNDDDGGHAMIFKDFDGNLKISYHAPNSKAERAVIYSLKDERGRLSIIK